MVAYEQLSELDDSRSGGARPLDGLRVIRAPRPGGEERVVTAQLPPGGELVAACRRAAELATQHGAVVVAQEVFGVPPESRDALGLQGAPWPVSWVLGVGPAAPCSTVLSAVTGAQVERLELHGRVVGSLVTDEDARLLRVAGLVAPDVAAPRPAQARAVFAAMEDLLARAGMGFLDVLRTWFYNEDILGWYGDFNRVRDEFFRARGVFDGLVPASTGIGGPNPAGAAVSAGLLAYQPVPGAAPGAARGAARALPSPLQCPALEYGSSFSRAAELDTPGLRRILVSGTASIEPGGQTAHLGDIDAQIDLTMRVVEAILRPRGASFADVVRGVVYLRRREDDAAWRRWARRRGAERMPVVVTHNVVCRDDLLFEIEVDAMTAGATCGTG